MEIKIRKGYKKPSAAIPNSTHRILFEEKFKTIASVDVVHKYDAFAPYEFEFENYIYEKEYVNFRASKI